MTHILTRYDGMPMLINADDVDWFESECEDSEYTLLYLKNADSILLKEDCDSVRVKLEDME